MYQQTIDLNLIPSGVPPVVHVNQYETQLDAFCFNLYKGTEPFTIPSNAAVLINGLKPDGNVFSYAASYASGNTAVCNCEQQMVPLAGDVVCELRVRTASEIIGTLNFIMRVEEAPLHDDSVISETTIPLIEQAIDIAANLAEYIEQTLSARDEAVASAADAKESEDNAAIYNSNVEQTYNSIETAKQNANTAAASANAAAAKLSNISATATTLSEGSSATASYDSNTGVMTFGIPRGATGESGIQTPISGMYALAIDADGYLYCYSNDEITESMFYYDEEEGNLYWMSPTTPIVTSVSGNMVTFVNKSSAENAVDVTSDIVPIQSFNGYDTPWPAGGGKNLLPPFANSSAGGLTMTVDSEGVCTVNGTRSDSSSLLLSNQSITLSAGSYTLSDGTDNINAMVQIYNATTEVLIWRGGGGSLTFAYNGTDNIRARVWVRGATTYNNVKLYPMIRKSTDSADFAPYSNICPISGWNAANITRIGKNLISFKERLLAWGAIYREIDNNTFVVTAVGSGYRSPYQFSETDIDVTLSGTITNSDGGFWRIDLLDSTNKNVGFLTAETTHVSAKASKIRLDYLTLGSGGQMANIQLEFGSTFTGYEPYTRDTYTNNLPSAFFGGTVDFVSGLVSSEWAEISSYSGETLPGEWLSSYDAYVPGTTPTNGAQVVYPLEEPITYQLTPQNIKILKGTNNIWSDSGDVTVKYNRWELE